MSQRSNADVIRIVTKWQEAGFFHELTCRVDSLHAALAPVERDGTVVLACPTCGETEEVPAIVLGSEAVIDYNRALTERYALALQRRAARQDVWFSIAVIMCCLTILPGLVWGATAAVFGSLAGAVICAVHARRSFRKLAAPAPDADASP